MAIRICFWIWAPLSATVLALWASAAGDSLIAKTSLIVILIALLLAGVLLMFMGLRDLIHDFRAYLNRRRDEWNGGSQQDHPARSS